MDWTPIYSVGIEEIDSQHRGLFAIIGELQQHLAANAPQKGVSECLDRLRRYTREHFTREETIMQAAGYDGLVRHRQQHDALCGRLDEFVARLGAAETSVREDLYFFLVSDWLASHILGADHDYRDCVSAHLAVEAKA